MFDGATFHVNELIKLIREAEIPVVKGKRGREEEVSDDGAGRKKYREE
jgi:hypothetical protein